MELIAVRQIKILFVLFKLIFALYQFLFALYHFFWQPAEK